MKLDTEMDRAIPDKSMWNTQPKKAEVVPGATATNKPQITKVAAATNPEAQASARVLMPTDPPLEYALILLLRINGICRQSCGFVVGEPLMRIDMSATFLIGFFVDNQFERVRLRDDQ